MIEAAGGPAAAAWEQLISPSPSPTADPPHTVPRHLLRDAQIEVRDAVVSALGDFEGLAAATHANCGLRGVQELAFAVVLQAFHALGIEDPEMREQREFGNAFISLARGNEEELTP